MDGQLRGIRQSQTNPKYLHTNSTSHKWPFSAVAELIDNAYDPDVLASKLDINYESFANHPCLTFTDDGNGLDGDSMHKMLSFGFSDKTDILTTPRHLAVGQYGNGFKSGSMRLGRDAIVFSNKGNTKTIGFLSQTFLENIKAMTVLVPIVSWNISNNQLVASEDAEPSLRAILKHSLFRTPDELFAQFKKIGSHKGTRIIIYNLKRDARNRLEFDFMREGHDIILAEEYSMTHPAVMQGHEDSDIPEHTYSLRAYCSILYMKPKLRIHLRRKKVQTLFVEKSLSKTERDTYKPKNVQLDRDRPVKITFGFNPKKNQYGILMYHKNRLIKPYVKVGYQAKPDQRGLGVLGVVECNFLQPTHNKQDFLDTNVYRSLITALGNKLNDYWNVKMGVQDLTLGGVVDLVKPEPADAPDDHWVQCDRCQKWRKLPPSANMAVVKRLKEWFCEMNPDPSHSHCSIQEEPEDPVDTTGATYDKTTYKRQQQFVENQRRAAENARRREERAKINEQKMQMQQEKKRLAQMQQQAAMQQQQQVIQQQEAQKKREMERLLQKIAVQQEQIKAQEQQIQQSIKQARNTAQNNPALDEDDDDIQLVEDDDDQPPQPGPIPLKITKVNDPKDQLYKNLKDFPNMPIPGSQAPQKRVLASGSKGTPAKLPRMESAGSTPATPNQIKLARKPQSQAPATVSTPPTKKLTVNKVSLVRTKRIHKRIQADEHQTEALDSGDEFEPKFKVASDKKSVSHNGTQVDEHDLTPGCCWMCQRMKIKQEIKQEMGEDGVTVNQEPVSIKHEPGMNGDHGYHDEPSTSHESPSRASPSNSMYMQKRFEMLTSERNSLKQELEKLKTERDKASRGPTVNQLSEKLEDSWQKIKDLESQIRAANSEKNVLNKEVEVLRISQGASGNEALNKSLAQLKGALEERDMLVESKADLERRVNQFTKTLKEKLDVQSKEIEDDYNKKLRAARERAASAEVRADNFKEEKREIEKRVNGLEKMLTEEQDKHKKTQESAEQARLNAVKEMELCKTKVQAVLKAECKQLEEKTNAWKARVAEAHRAKEEFVEKTKKAESELAEVKGKYQDLMKRHEGFDKELKETKEKADAEMAGMRLKHKSEMKQVEEESNKRLLECRQELQVMVKEIKQEHEEKQQDLTKKLAAAQQEVSDSLNKWEDSEKKAQDLNQQLTQAHNQARNVQDQLENLRVNVFNLLRTLIDQEDVNLDNYVDDSRSTQVDDIVQRVLDDNQ